jgi:L-ribulose-5-phosphate 4-epimerase
MLADLLDEMMQHLYKNRPQNTEEILQMIAAIEKSLQPIQTTGKIPGTMSNHTALKKETFEANMQLPKLGLVLFTFGNVSVADREKGIFAIKPSGIPYEELTADKMVIVDFDGNTIEGELRPSSDTKTHAVLYKHWEKIGAIVHTHSTNATAWAQSLRDIPILGTTHADHNTVDIPCAAPMDDAMIAGNYEYETGFQIMNCFKEKGLSYEEVEMMVQLQIMVQ